ncbi:LuxR C-terminal-related transcriptional regulator [Devosia rhizoryzae]|uniref:Response regulator transcription factor n=1 Tax=Devosia rhizoryzae TaxID=2774137 RepID=A0ABX7C9K0_9HYPH|nr:response regulator transcription factor [Devosia rhizoryzae]QQR40397.1 response regulator transcription factor [Devosia rhizoryzae]
MSQSVTIVLADSQQIFLLGLREVFARSDEISVVAEAHDAMEAMRFAAQHQPDMLLIELWMQGHDSSEHFEEVFSASPKTKVVALAASESNKDMVSAMSAGASGFASKHATPDELVSIIRRVHEGETYLSPQALAGWLAGLKATPRQENSAASGINLTSQELAVLSAITEGRNNKEAASLLGISAATVKYHLAHIFVKLGVRNRVEAAVLARGLVEDKDV